MLFRDTVLVDELSHSYQGKQAVQLSLFLFLEWGFFDFVVLKDELPPLFKEDLIVFSNETG